MDSAILEAIAAGRGLTVAQQAEVEAARGEESAQVLQARAASLEAGTYYTTAVKRVGKTTLPPRTVEHVATSERPVGYFGDVVLQSAWDFTGFFAIGGPLLWYHDGSIPPLGRVTEMRKAKIGGEKVVVSRSEFTPEGVHPFADLIWNLVDLDFVRGVSVGFRIKKTNDSLTEKERKEYGIGPAGMLITLAELLELTATQIPADKAAVKLAAVSARVERAVRDGYIETNLLRAIAAKMPELSELERRLGLDEGAAEDVEERHVQRADLPDSIERRLRELEEWKRTAGPALDALRRRVDGLAERHQQPGAAAQSEADIFFSDIGSVLPAPRELADSIFKKD